MSIAQLDVVAKKFFLGPKKIFGAIGLVFGCASLAIVETGGMEVMPAFFFKSARSP